MNWELRDFSVGEAAELCGLSEGHLKVIIHRNRAIADLFSGKHGSRRLFSLRDIAVIRLAHVLERFGRTWLFAISDAFEVLEDPPPRTAMLSMRLGRSLPTPTNYRPERPLDEPTLLIPIGKIVHDLKEAARVAVQ
ncbi:hypothetical protein T8J41_15935 [Nitratireductor rhodophyticola]|uniref:hypothetical protein n=1 Tax=Nitratireductor rhodophyticola TaxID=2854036 RepID=UPI002AC985D6|nr:hypothetical protein [Nitratireductor rhodophyticola]WPZ13623.1 hypothetical protein T8J41_15935 [Nitratireductor rhodophyticola]